ncbi:MAG: phytoene desaturase family protein [Planctomycetota bacterium]|nr:phytoene desaturase family protein [Planctomycetota bacterium]
MTTLTRPTMHPDLPCATFQGETLIPGKGNEGPGTVGIIGAGPGGLAAAVLLAASGVRVRVYEADTTIGGRTARVRAGAFGFDKGPTFFMMPYVLEEIFASAGRSMHEYLELTRLDPMYRLMLGRPGQSPLQLDTTQDIAEMGRRISAIDKADGANFARFIADNRYKLHHSEPILRNAMRSPLDLFSASTWRDTLKVGPVLAPHLSVHELLGKYFRNPYVKLAVCFQSKYLGMSPYECPSLFTILPFIEYEWGVWHPKGGCHALMVALAELATELGAQIVTGAPVSRINFESSPQGPRATSVVVGNTRHEHDDCIINADATWALKNLIPSSSIDEARINGGDYSVSHIDSRRYSCSTAMLYLGVKGKVDLPHHTIYVSERYKENLEDIVSRGALSEDPSIYVCNPSRLDPTLAPPGDSSLYVLMPTPNCSSPIDWERERAGIRDEMLDQMERRFGLEGIRGRIVEERATMPRDWASANINFGATFNLAHNLGQMLHLRPQNRLKGFDNLYLVGGGTHPGSGLPTIFLSAQISCRMVCERMGVAFAGDSGVPKKIAVENGPGAAYRV